MNLRFLRLFVVAILAGCAAPRPPRVPRPPGVAPRAAVVDDRALLAMLASDGRHATTAEGPHGAFVVTFDAPIPMGEPEPFLRSFAVRYGSPLGFEARDAWLETETQTGERSLVDIHAPRDTGCRSLRLTFRTTDVGGPSLSAVVRVCDPLLGRPPAYGSRRLPSTASGSHEVLAQCGLWGNGTVASYGGRALDKFGDVYTFGVMGFDGHTVSPSMFLEYVGTVRPEEVERLIDDTAEASQASVRAPEVAPGQTRCMSILDTPRGPRALDLEAREGGAATRARTWLHGRLDPRE